MEFLDLRKQYLSIAEEINSVILQTLKKGKFILGEQVEAFEEEFAEYCGTKYAVGVGSGTDAIHLSLVALGIEPGDEVITVPNTAIFTIIGIRLAEAIPKFVDIHNKSYTMDESQIVSVITKRTEAIIPVHIYGQCCDMDAILDIAKYYKLKVIEDACQAHGAEYKCRKAGSMGICGCFSFYPTKNIGAYGDGGIITTNDRRIASKLKILRDGGRKENLIITRGFNSRLDELQAAVLRVKLKYLDIWNGMRINKAELYSSLICNRISPKRANFSKEITGEDFIRHPYSTNYNKHVFHLYVINLKYRDLLRNYLFEKNIETAIHYPQIIRSEIKDEFPVAEETSKRILSLPLYPELEDSKIRKICKVINDYSWEGSRRA